MAEIKIANKNEIKDGQGTVVLVNEKEIALFNIQGNFYAIDNNCCHRGGPLAEGEIEDKIGVPNTTIPAPMNGLISEKLVLKTDKGAYQINFENYKKIKDILQKIRNKVVHSGGKNVS